MPFTKIPILSSPYSPLATSITVKKYENSFRWWFRVHCSREISITYWNLPDCGTQGKVTFDFWDIAAYYRWLPGRGIFLALKCKLDRTFGKDWHSVGEWCKRWFVPDAPTFSATKCIANTRNYLTLCEKNFWKFTTHISSYDIELEWLKYLRRGFI